MFYAISHFSKFVRPNAVRIGIDSSSQTSLWATAFKNEDDSKVFIIFNPTEESISYDLVSDESKIRINLDSQALQTVICK